MKFNKTISTIIFSLALVGCTKITDPIITSHGYAPNQYDVEIIKSQSFNKQQIQEEFGVPFMVGVNNPDYWYYLSYQTTRYGFGEKKYKNFNLIELKFENDTISFVKKYTESDFKQIAFKKGSTKTSGKQLGVFEQIVGNIGRFRPKEKSTTH